MTQSVPGIDAAAEYLGLFVYGSVGSFALLAQDASYAPNIRDRIVLSRMAAAELADIDPAEKFGKAQVGDFDALMQSYRDLISDFLLRAVPRDWWERLVRSYVGYHLLEDLLVELAGAAPEWVRALTEGTFNASAHAEWTVQQLQEVVDDEPQLSARLALWGRRVMGECVLLVQKLFLEHPALLGYAGGADGVHALIGRLQAEHSRRLSRLGLAS